MHTNGLGAVYHTHIHRPMLQLGYMTCCKKVLPRYYTTPVDKIARLLLCIPQPVQFGITNSPTRRVVVNRLPRGTRRREPLQDGASRKIKKEVSGRLSKSELRSGAANYVHGLNEITRKQAERREGSASCRVTRSPRYCS